MSSSTITAKLLVCDIPRALAARSAACVYMVRLLRLARCDPYLLMICLATLPACFSTHWLLLFVTSAIIPLPEYPIAHAQRWEVSRPKDARVHFQHRRGWIKPNEVPPTRRVRKEGLTPNVTSFGLSRPSYLLKNLDIPAKQESTDQSLLVASKFGVIFLGFYRSF